jgi:CubicO group peptidase (beta-lactamase class C family)
MMNFGLPFLLLLCAFTNAQCPYHPTAFYIPNVAQEPEIAAAFSSLSQRVSASTPILNQTAGATALTVSVSFFNETVFFQGVGVRRYDTARFEAPDLDTMFRVGSVTKLFTSLLLLVAVDQGLLSGLDEPVSKTVKFSMLAPYSHATLASIDDITWQQLVSHMAGLPREAPCDPNAGCLTDTTTTILARLANIRLQTLPSTRAGYSNLGFSLIGNLAAEHLFGSSFAAALQKFVLAPLGLTRTSVSVKAWLAGAYGPNLALSYEPGTLNVNPAIAAQLGWSAPCGEMISTPRDLNTVTQELINGYNGGGVLFGRKSLYRAAMQPQFMDGAGDTGFASPYEVVFLRSFIVDRKGGNVAGYSALVAVVPELGISMTLNINSAFNELGAPGVHFIDVMVVAFSSMFSRLEPKRLYAVPTNHPLSDYVGSYSLGGTAITATVKASANPTELLFDVSLVPIKPLALRWSNAGNEDFVVQLTTNGTHVNPPTIDCSTVDVFDIVGAVATFARDPVSNNVTSVALPSLGDVLVFQKTN